MYELNFRPLPFRELAPVRGWCTDLPPEVLAEPGTYSFNYSKPRPFDDPQTDSAVPQRTGYAVVRSEKLASGLILVVGRDVVERRGFTAILLQWFAVGAGGINAPRKACTETARRNFPEAARQRLETAGFTLKPDFFLPKDVGVKLAGFADVGSLWDYQGPTSYKGQRVRFAGSNDGMDIRASVGFGLLWDSPLGPIRFDFAFPLMKESYDRTQWFRFSGGTSF